MNKNRKPQNGFYSAAFADVKHLLLICVLIIAKFKK